MEDAALNMVWSAVAGLAVGAVAKVCVPGWTTSGAVVTMLLGLAGALLANTVGIAIGLFYSGRTPGLLLSAVGAAAMLAVDRVLTAD
ncbi:MAG: GlsB/YeaQ/YmgE family stress response membrane protein [Acidobacteria bacterium]|nr:GlsB/YeaQ/YmgE family stress response membrane protein [Acidobacteriota bacterium]